MRSILIILLSLLFVNTAIADTWSKFTKKISQCPSKNIKHIKITGTSYADGETEKRVTFFNVSENKVMFKSMSVDGKSVSDIDDETKESLQEEVLFLKSKFNLEKILRQKPTNRHVTYCKKDANCKLYKLIYKYKGTMFNLILKINTSDGTPISYQLNNIDIFKQGSATITRFNESVSFSKLNDCFIPTDKKHSVDMKYKVMPGYSIPIISKSCYSYNGRGCED